MKLPLYLAVFAFGLTGLARAADAPGQTKKDDVPVLTEAEIQLAVERDAIEKARGHARNGKVKEVEDELTPLNLAKKNTSEWHLETAQRLIQIAEQMAREADPEKVPALVNRALEHLSDAEKKTADAVTRASAKTLAGFIHERYLADDAAALASYEAAAALAPGEQGARAKEAAERLKRTDENVKEKIRAGGK